MNVPDSPASIFRARPAPTTRPSASASNLQNSAATVPCCPAGVTPLLPTAAPPPPRSVKLRISL